MAFEPWQGGQPAHPSRHVPVMRASHADRERAVDVLKAGFAEGRLAQPEYEQRVALAYQAQTYADLNALVADLPQGPMAQQFQMPQPVQPIPATFLAMPQPRPTNGAALGSLICGLLTPVTWGLTAIPAVILGHKGRSEIRDSGERGDGMAVAGLILGWLTIGCVMALLLTFVVLGLLVDAGPGD